MSSFRTIHTIRRKITGAVNEDGCYDAGNYINLPVYASVQPVNLQEYTDYEPQGGRTADLVKVYTSVELYPMREGIEADVLEWLYPLRNMEEQRHKSLQSNFQGD